MANAKEGWTFSQVPIWSTCDPRLSDGAFRLFSYLVWRQGTNPDAWPSVPTMARDLGVSDETIRRRIKELDNAGYTSITERPGRANRYAMHANPDGASDQYTPTPHKTEGGTPHKTERGSEPTPPTEMRGDPSQNCGGTPHKTVTHNDTHEQEPKNEIGAGAPGTALFDEMFPKDQEHALPEPTPYTALDLQTQAGRDRALAHVLGTRNRAMVERPWRDLEAVCPTIAKYDPDVAIDRDFVLQTITLVMSTGIPLDLQKPGEVRYWLKSTESIGRKCNWRLAIVETALDMALRSGLSIKSPASIEYALADAMRAATESGQPLVAGGAGQVVTVLHKIRSEK